MGSCGECLARTIIGVVNFVILAFAVVAVALLYVSKDKQDWLQFDIKNSKNAPFIALIVIAVFAVISSLVGFFIICCKSMCWRVTYLVLITIAIIIEIVGIVLAFKYTSVILDGIRGVWDTSEVRPKIEQEFNCCGFDDFKLEGCAAPDANESCVGKLKDSIEAISHKVGYVVIALAVIEVIVFIFAIYLVCSAKKQRENNGITDFS